MLGHVEARSPETVNAKVSTGAIEVRASEIRLLNDAKTPPFTIGGDEASVSEETRLRYRYLDLRRPGLQGNIILRHKITMAAEGRVSPILSKLAGVVSIALWTSIAVSSRFIGLFT